MGLTEPAEERDEVIQFSEPKKGLYKKLIVRDGRLVGGILMGDISKAGFLMQAFDRDAPLPDERLAMLFDLGTPPQQVSAAEMPGDMQVCNCNGVSKARIGDCVATGMDATAVMDATRAGKGCGSCKGLVGEIVDLFRAMLPPPVATSIAAADGTFSIVPHMPDGVCTPEALLRIAQIALKYNVRQVSLVDGPTLGLSGGRGRPMSAPFSKSSRPAPAKRPSSAIRPVR